jgi:uncharacterized damage-inducible protein DinB
MPTIDALIKQYLAGPDRLRKRICGMSPEQLRARPVPGRWSTLEVVGHVVDSDSIYADRMKRVIAEDQPTLVNADESLWVVHLACHVRDVEEELAMLQLTRNQMARILRQAPPDAFDRKGIHSTAGPVTLGQLFESVVEHLEHHAEFIDAKRAALGLSVAE